MGQGGDSGGAMNIDNFRESVKSGYLPSLETITSKGVFAEYFFDTGMLETDKIFEPSYSFARCMNPFTDELEDYFALGMNCKDDGKNLRRNLNCVVVLDISGSMGSGFYGEDADKDDGNDEKKTKMQIANEMLVEILKILRIGDRFGIVLFDTEVEVLQPMSKFEDLKIEELSKNILEIKHRGGTDMEIGQRKAIEMIQNFLSTDESSQKNDNRIIFLTDACPNVGGGPDTLLGMSKIAAKKNNIFSTFFGVGLDFNMELVEEITKVRGSNYFSVHSRKQFKKILVEVVTPICYGTTLFFESEGLEIESIYGSSDQALKNSNCLLNIETVGAGPKDEEQGLKGGMILVKLKKKLTPNLDPSNLIKFTLKYTPAGAAAGEEEEVHFVDTMNYDERIEKMISGGGGGGSGGGGGTPPKIFESNGVRKAVLLARYTDFLMDYIRSIKNHRQNQLEDQLSSKKTSDEQLKVDVDVVESKEEEEEEEENSSKQKPDIPERLEKEWKEFCEYFKREMEVIGDEALARELEILKKLIKVDLTLK